MNCWRAHDGSDAGFYVVFVRLGLRHCMDSGEDFAKVRGTGISARAVVDEFGGLVVVENWI